MNLYGYVAGDPVNMTDPWGLVGQDGSGDGRGQGDDRIPLCSALVTPTTGPCRVGGIIVRAPFRVEPPGSPRSGTTARANPNTPSGGSTSPPPNNQPPRTQAECESLIPSGDTRFRCNAEGKLEMTPEYARQACQNYNRFQNSNNWNGLGQSLLGGGLVGAGFSGVRTLANMAGPLGIILEIAGLTTSLLSLSPPPPGCNEQ